MPRYKVKVPGFYEGRFYDPNGKRPVLETDKPFTKKNKMPSWLTDMPKESDAVKKKREAQEVSQAAADEQKDTDDKNEIATASSAGDGEDTSFLGKVKNAVAGKSSNVETL